MKHKNSVFYDLSYGYICMFRKKDLIILKQFYFSPLMPAWPYKQKGIEHGSEMMNIF